MCVCVEKRDDLVRSDAHGHCSPDGLTGNLSSHHVGESSIKPGKELQNGHLKGRRSVSIEAIIRLDYDEASVPFWCAQV